MTKGCEKCLVSEAKKLRSLFGATLHEKKEQRCFASLNMTASRLIDLIKD